MNRKLITLAVVLLAGCGGGSDGSVDTSAPLQAYGFGGNGEAYVATIDAQRTRYNYATIDPKTGVESGLSSAILTLQDAQLGIYSIEGHGKHVLALNADQDTMLASTSTFAAESATPTLFTLKPLHSYSTIAGIYYLQNRPYWLRLDIASTGVASVSCESRTEVLVLDDGQELRRNWCDEFVSGTATVQPLTYPYWAIELTVLGTASNPAFDESQRSYVFNLSGTALIGMQGGGRTMFGKPFSQVCERGVCDGPGFFSDEFAWPDAAAFSKVAWAGKWVFAREGGDSVLLDLEASGRGALSNNRRLNVLEIAAGAPNANSLNEVTFYSYAEGVNNIRQFYGQAFVSARGPGVAAERSSYNSTALFDRIPSDVKTLYFRASEGFEARLFSLPREDASCVLADSDVTVFIEVLADDGTVVSTTPLQRFVDYDSNLFDYKVLLKNSLPKTDEQGRAVRLAIKLGRVPFLVPEYPRVRGIQVRR